MTEPVSPDTTPKPRDYAREWAHYRRTAMPSVRLSRSKRRVLVTAMYAVFVASPVLLLAFLSAPTPFPFFLLFVWSVLWFLVSMTVPSSQKRKRSELDERERAQRDRATAQAYWVIVAVVFVSFLYFGIASNTRLGLPFPSSVNQFAALVSPFLWVVITLPTAILAWTIPDPAPET